MSFVTSRGKRNLSEFKHIHNFTETHSNASFKMYLKINEQHAISYKTKRKYSLNSRYCLKHVLLYCFAL